MISVVEYGKNIGTLKNIFWDLPQAVIFAKRIIAFSDNSYDCIGRYQWCCRAKQEYIKIVGDF